MHSLSLFEAPHCPGRLRVKHAALNHIYQCSRCSCAHDISLLVARSLALFGVLHRAGRLHIA